MDFNVLVFLVQYMMYFSIPLLIVALGGMFSERSGVVNIALEGIMIIGAFAGVLFLYFVQEASTGTIVMEDAFGAFHEVPRPPINPQILLLAALAISAISGALISLAHAYASMHMKASQVISGTAINMLAPALAIYVARTIRTVQQIPIPRWFYIEAVPGLGDIPVIGPFFFQKTYITTFIGILILIASWIVLYKTPFGLRLRSCGEHPQAADSVGINVYKMRYSGVLISGALGGIGGLSFVIPTTISYDANVAGYGFLALAVLIFGQWKPGRIFFAALFFGLMKTISFAHSSISFLSALAIPSVVYKTIPFIATLVVLAFTSRKSQSPKASGIPYDKGTR